jgi:hypothetical protein
MSFDLFGKNNRYGMEMKGTGICQQEPGFTNENPDSPGLKKMINHD